MFNDMVKDIGQYNAIWTLIRILFYKIQLYFEM